MTLFKPLTDHYMNLSAEENIHISMHRKENDHFVNF